jgi:nucleotide-binding universal stress UspA family protein
MFRSILIATDGSDLAARGAKQAVALAKSLGAKVIAVNVTAPFFWFAPNMPSDAESAYLQGTRQAASRALGVVADAAKSAEVVCETVQVEKEHAYEAIIDTATSRSCDLIVMASHGRSGISAIVLGSETVKVLTHSKIPVLVLH